MQNMRMRSLGSTNERNTRQNRILRKRSNDRLFDIKTVLKQSDSCMSLCYSGSDKLCDRGMDIGDVFRGYDYEVEGWRVGSCCRNCIYDYLSDQLYGLWVLGRYLGTVSRFPAFDITVIYRRDCEPVFRYSFEI